MNSLLTAETILAHLRIEESATALEIAEAIDAPLSTVYNALNRLDLPNDGKKPRRYFLKPSSVLDVLKRHRAELDQIIATLEHLE